ncbi:class II glutamine amidotransferase [Conexibacter sp. W3-3-2]|uniref:Class II glutamine amidotransferase n=1 Tax=Paraconexibacter algicola TaxID=2133960 RepID=A0A2T4UMB6_9ACTN|nr:MULTISPECIES: class II glutamine amidotransferase [Solirubrobacterales]MTD46676.1 class II glutamine amidotransferase [Conexibacter sp. W3-3-2]PTL60397.1 class II glutamine amidotransferase [Paraconexibacter algicola]
MCRVTAYLGDEAVVDDLLFGADRALVRQTVDSELMSLLNLGGFGLAAWDAGSHDPARPFTYRVPTLPNFDRNLRALTRKVRARALLAHVRGVVYDERERIGPHNLHPFCFDGAHVALAQNGDLYDFGAMRYDLLEHVGPDLANRIEGTTDTEWVYALVLSGLPDPLGPATIDDATVAVERALTVLRGIRERRGIRTQSPVNLVLSDGEWLLTTRFAYDYGWYPDDDSFFAGEREHDFTTLWYTTGGAFAGRDGTYAMGDGPTTSIVVASEPLTRDHTGWIEVPEYSMLRAFPDPATAELTIETRELPL